MKESGWQWRSKTMGKILSSVWFFPLVLVAIKLWLTRDLPLITYFGSHDDLRYIVMANSLVNFEVPPYDAYTLMRQPGYPAYIALSYWLGFSLRLSQELLYLGSGLFLGRALYKYYPNRWAIWLFSALYILNPGSFHWNRLIMPEALYVPLTALILSCLLRLVYGEGRRHFWKWSAILGLVLAWFWNTRPEGVWIIPTIAFAYGLIIFQKFVNPQFDRTFFISCFKKKNIYKNILGSLVFAIAPTILVTSLICLFNFFNYGLYLTNDLTAPGFKAAYSQMIRVNPERWRRWVPVTAETRHEIYAVSPSFQKLSSFLETEKGQAWFALTCNERVNICDDYIGGVFIWALRDAVADLGYYRTAIDTEKFYRKIASEIQAACNQHKLNCHRSPFAISSFSPQLRPQYIGQFFNSLGILSKNAIGSSLDLNLTSGYQNDELYKIHYQIITRESLEFRNQTSDTSLEIKIIHGWTKLYELLLPILLGLAGLGIILASYQNLLFKKNLLIPVSIFSLVISCSIARLLLIAYIRTVSMPVKGFRYLWPGIPFLLFAIAIGISYLEPILNHHRITHR